MDATALLMIWFAATLGLVAVFGRRLWRGITGWPRLYLVLCWALVSIGLIQVSATTLRFDRFDESALWFATAGLAIALTGALNLLNMGRHLEDRGVRGVCLAANLATTAVFVAVATHRGAEPPHDPVSVVLLTVAVLATLLGRGVRMRRV